MARKKSVTPNPEEQELMDQEAETVDGFESEDAAEEGAAPSEEDMAQMEQEYGAVPVDGAMLPDDGSDIPVGEDVPDSGEQSYEGSENFPSDDPFPEDTPEETGPSEEDFGEDAPSGTEPMDGDAGASDDYAALLKELGNSGTGGEEQAPLSVDAEGPDERYSADDLLLLSQEGDAGEDDAPDEVAAPNSEPERPAARRRRERPSPVAAAASRRRERVLTIDARDEIQTDEDREAIIWHDVQNSHRTRRILTGMLDGVEKTDSGLTLAVVNYKGFRVAIPVKEMMLYTGKTPSGREYIELMDQLNRILNARLGSEIDFIVKGYDNETRSVVGSRREAMLRKRQTFYMDTDELGEHMIYEGRVVQARVVAVAEKVIRVEVFGVETSIVARGLSWEWIGNARDHFNVGDRILVRVLKINRTDVEHLTIRVDVRSVSATNSHDNLKKCMPQCRYAGRVTDVRNGVVFIRLNNGVNAIAHSCYDSRYPGKKDDVSFAVTRLDEEQGVAIGIITRIIKQNL